MVTFTGNRLDVLHTLSCLIFNVTSYDKYYYNPHLLNEETEA